MQVYKTDSDEFDPEYLAYLGTLTSEVGTGKFRLTRNPDGDLVRVEFWVQRGEDEDHFRYWDHFDFPLPGWMKP